jgi:hypothetical protein
MTPRIYSPTVYLNRFRLQRYIKKHHLQQNAKKGDLVKWFHYYEIEFKGQPSWIVVKELDNVEKHIYSIVDATKYKSD